MFNFPDAPSADLDAFWKDPRDGSELWTPHHAVVTSFIFFAKGEGDVSRHDVALACFMARSMAMINLREFGDGIHIQWQRRWQGEPWKALWLAKSSFVPRTRHLKGLEEVTSVPVELVFSCVEQVVPIAVFGDRPESLATLKSHHFAALAFIGSLPPKRYFQKAFSALLTASAVVGQHDVFVTALSCCDAGHPLCPMGYLDSRWGVVSATGLRPHANYLQQLLGAIPANKFPIFDKRRLCLLASQFGHLETVKYLHFEMFLDFNVTTARGLTPMIGAATNGHTDVVKFLHKEVRADPHGCTLEGESAIYGACANGHLDIVRYLIEFGHVDFHRSAEGKPPPFIAAAENGHLDVVEYLHAVAQVDTRTPMDDGYTATYAAASNNHVHVLEYLHRARILDCYTPCRGQTPFAAACMNGHVEALRYLKEVAPVFRPECKANKTVEKKQSTQDTNSEEKSQVPSFTAMEAAQLERNVFVDAFYGACESGHLNVAQYLFQECGVTRDDLNAAVDQQNQRSVAHAAAVSGNLEMMRYVCERIGVDCTSRDELGRTPFSFAAEYGHIEQCRYLHAIARESAHVPSKRVETPCFFAAANSHLDVVEFIFYEVHGDCHTQSSSGEAPIHVAAFEGNLPIVKFLHEVAKVDVGIPMDNGMTPYMLARQKAHYHVMAYLVDVAHVESLLSRDASDMDRTSTAEGMIPTATASGIADTRSMTESTPVDNEDRVDLPDGRDVFDMLGDKSDI